MTLNTAGNQTVTATDGTTSSIKGADGPVTVDAGSLSSITISPLNSSTSAGVPVAYHALAWDGAFGSGAGSGNEIGEVTSQATFSITPDGSCSGGTGTGGAAPGNNQCGSNAADTGGSHHTVTASDAGQNASTNLTVNTGPGQLVFTSGPDAPALITNGGFETGLTGWAAGGTPTPGPSSAEAYSGTGSALLGSSSGPSLPGDSQLSQAFTVPSTGTPVLTFLYWPETTASSADFQEAYVTCGSCAAAQNNLVVFKTLSDAQMWHPVQFDLSYAKGETVDIVFDVHQAGGASATAMYVDDVLVSGQAAGAPFGAQPVVQLEDSLGNHISTAGVVVTLGLAGGAGNGTPGAALTCSSPTATTNVSGTATFSGCTVDEVVPRIVEFGAVQPYVG